jgi:hypothetical protein
LLYSVATNQLHGGRPDNRVATDCRRLSNEALVIVSEWPQ